ncbi:MAG: GAF domain-containing protein [Gammaproteobacteria bacterium]|jgi:PAS domain S-box-containing protein
MRLKSFLSLLTQHVRKLWPRRIINKIALINILVLLATVSALSWYALLEKSSYQIRANIDRYQQHARQIAHVSAPYLDDDNIDDLEEVIASFLMMDEVYDLTITDVAFNTIVALRHQDNGDVIVFDNTEKPIAPVQSGQATRTNGSSLQLWQQIKTDTPLGWVYINQTTQPLESLTLDFIKTTIAALIFSIAICLLALQRILREPMQSLRRAAEFSEWLDMAQGNHLHLQTSSREVEQIIHSLNKTSEKMYHRGIQDKRTHHLIDTIRGIQTKYIERCDSQELNDSILDQVVNLTGSEYGFMGEVKTSKRGKPFIKIFNFSKLSRNVHLQKFMDQYAPPNMEFHNTHNLFGTVLQTGKPTIANDPMRDPRAGGLPPGHPPIFSFLALPVFYDDVLVAVIGIANRRGGYDQALIDFLDPLATTVGHIVVANRHNENREGARRQLEQKEAMLRRILSTVSDSIITINQGGFIETANPATESMFGYLFEELENQHINQLIPGLFDDQFRTQYIADNAERYHDALGKTKDGKTFAIELTAGEFKLGDEQMYTMTVIDLSHLQHSSSVLGRIDDMFVDVQRMVHAGTWEWHVDSNKITASQEVFHILGMEPRQGWLDMPSFVAPFVDEDKQIFMLAIERCLENKEPFVIEARLPVDGSYQHFAQIQGNPQHDDEGRVTKVVGVVQDVTDTRQIIKMKDEFITSVSEEIRSPLASIRGSIGLLTGEVSKYISDKEKFLLDTAYQNTDRLLLLINDILDIEHIATGATVFNMEFLECRTLLDTVLMANRDIETNYRVKFRLDIESKDIVLIADKQRLIQLFSILLSNAAKHSPMGAEVHIGAAVVDNSLVITVTDNGEGIPEEMQPALFDLYARTKYFKSQHPESTGLGLCVAKSIVERHKGTIDFESQEDKGTTIYVRLPVPQQNVAVLNL